MNEELDDAFVEGLTAVVTQFLCDQNILFKYIECLNKYKHKGIEDNTIESVVRSAIRQGSKKKAACINFFNWSFKWIQTPEGDKYWANIDTQFYSFILKTDFFKNNFD